MGRRLNRHPRGVSDAEESAVYIGEESVVAAMRFLDALEDTLEALLATPEMGRVREFVRTELTGLRSFPVRGFEKYLVFYRATEHGIDVLRILHGARDLGAILD